MRNRIEALGDIEDPEAGHDVILSTYRNVLSHEYETILKNMGKDQGEERGKIENGGREIGTTETEMKREVYCEKH